MGGGVIFRKVETMVCNEIICYVLFQCKPDLLEIKCFPLALLLFNMKTLIDRADLQ